MGFYTQVIAVAKEAKPDNDTVDKVNALLLEQMDAVKLNSANIEQAEAMAAVAQRIFDGLKIKSVNRALVTKGIN